ncbi:MAG: oligosaccharide flippase family protein [Patescibacteria group bacterium]
MRTHIDTIFDKLNRYTHTDTRYLAHGGFWLSLGSFIELSLGALTVIILANLIDKENLGLYQFIISTATILGAFTLTGLATTVTTETARGNDGALWSGVRTKLKWNIGITLASLSIALYYFINDNSTLAIAFLIVGTFSPFIESFHLYRPFIIGKQAYKFSAFINVFRMIIPTFILIGTVLITQNPLILITAYFAGHLIAVTTGYFITLYYFNPPRIDTFRGKTLFSKHLSIMQLAGRVAQHIDKVLVYHHLGAIAVATYTIAQMPTKYTKNMLGVVQSLVLPKVSQRDFTSLQYTLPHKVWLFFSIVSAIVLSYIILAPLIFGLIFPQYPESVIISQILALSILVLPFSVYGQTLIAHEKTTWLYIFQISGVGLKLTLLYILLPIYGIWGAVYAILISEMVNSLFVISIFRHIK